MASNSFCTNCGEKLSVGVNFCGVCGFKAQASDETPSQVRQSARSGEHPFIALVEIDDRAHWVRFLDEIRLLAVSQPQWSDAAGDRFQIAKSLDVVTQADEAVRVPEGFLWSVVQQWDGPDLDLERFETDFRIPFLQSGALVPILSSSLDDLDQARFVANQSWSPELKEFGAFYTDWIRFICPRCFYRYWHNPDVEDFDRSCVDQDCPACNGDGDVDFEYGTKLSAL